MRISYRWLTELVETSLDAAAVARALTGAGLEVEGQTRVGDFAGVIAAEVRGKRPHPDAKKLTLVDVWDGATVTQVVCGAANVPEAGARVLWAPPGARLPDGRVLEAKEVRGVVSPGMLCAEDELGLGDSHEGILVFADDGPAPGEDAARALGLPDEIFEVNVTPNRPDCMSHVGLGRELVALGVATWRDAPPRLEVATHAVAAAADDAGLVRIDDVVGCARYTALCLDGVRVAPSPLAVRVRLALLGVRAISNVVDATNWVLLETGQPLHAFDRDQLQTPVRVRRAQAGEKMRTLDDVERTLVADDVLICDGAGPVALAGVMGGGNSEVSAATTRVFIESAWFDPPSVRRTSRRLGLRTEASQRFERGADPDGAPEASLRVARLIADWGGGAPSTPLYDVYPRRLPSISLTLRPARTRAFLGVADLDAERQHDYLRGLGLGADLGDDGRLRVTVPPRRPDLTREIDLVEEIARLHGYERVPETLPLMRAAPAPQPLARDERVRDVLAGLGFDEIISYAFVAPEQIGALGWPADDRRARPILLTNPLRRELSALRTSLMPGLLEALRRNVARGQSDVRLFEVGTVFFASADALPHEHPHAAALLHGRHPGWLQSGAGYDFFDAKGALVELLARLGHAAVVVPATERVPWLHPNMQGELRLGDVTLGCVGVLHPDLQRKLELPSPVAAFELDLARIPDGARRQLGELPRFPAVTRDVSFFADVGIPARDVEAALRAPADPLLVEVRVREDYREAGRVPAGKKSMLWTLTYRAPDRTLTDAEVQAAHQRLLQSLVATLAIELR